MWGPMRRGRPLRQQSDKARARDAEYQVARAARREQVRGLCEGDTPASPPRQHQGGHAHHVARRSQGGDNGVENLRWLCWEAHDWVHANPAAARELGLLAGG